MRQNNLTCTCICLTAEAGERVIISVAPSEAMARRCLESIWGMSGKARDMRSNAAYEKTQVMRQTPIVMPKTCMLGKRVQLGDVSMHCMVQAACLFP